MTLGTPIYDVVIVGGGTAGCVIASRLSETSSLRVLLLEAGPDNNADPKVTTPLRSPEMFGDPNYDWGYLTVPQRHAGNREFNQTRGRMLGGSSAINSHSLVYPNQAMHDKWAEVVGDAAWSWDEMQSFYQKFQTVQVRNKSQDPLTMDPTQGPIQASYPRHLNKLQSAWEEAFKALDAFHPASGMNGKAIGGTTNTNAIDGRDGKGERSHAGKAYLDPARGRDNLTVVTEAKVKKIIFEHVHGAEGGLCATGVSYEKDGQPILATAKQEIVLCAGVFGSPQLLEVSGIGNKGILDQAGVECLLHLPGVGENLQDHLNFGPSVEVQPSIATLDDLSRNQLSADAAQAEYDAHRTGVLSEGGAYSYAYWPLQMLETPPEKVALDNAIADADTGSSPLSELQFDFNRTMLQDPGEASATVLMIPKRRYAKPDEPTVGNYMTLLAMLSHPYSRGSSHIVSPDPATQPAIDFNYLSHPLDVEIMAQHIIQIERFLQNPQLAPVLQPNGRRFPDDIGCAQRSREDLKQLIRRYGATNYHPCGTCVMASADLGGVVDAELLVRGVENLRVCDASIFAIIPRGNILSTVYAVAEKGAEMILRRSRYAT